MPNQFYPMAVVVKANAMSIVEETAKEIEQLLIETYGDDYGITIYDPGDVIPIVAFFNDSDTDEETLEGE